MIMFANKVLLSEKLYATLNGKYNNYLSEDLKCDGYPSWWEHVGIISSLLGVGNSACYGKFTWTLSYKDMLAKQISTDVV